MPKIEQWIIDKVKDAADIVEVVGDFVDLRKAGVNYTGYCPFHDDHNDGNFIVRPKTARQYGNTYHCFVCMKAGDGGGPVDFLMKHEKLSFADAIRWLGKKYSIEVDNVPLNYTPPPRKPTPPPPPTMEIPREWVTRTMQLTQGNNFVNWFCQLPWTGEQQQRLSETLWMYCVGGYHDGSVCWWQIDEQGVPRAAKLMKYQQDGHRCKGRYDTSYLYAKPECKSRLDPDNHTILHPLFGSHLLKRYPDAIVNLVESEKTALVMANFYGCPERQLWLACGGLQWLQLAAMQPLIDQGRTVWLWPDKDGVDEWQKLVDKLGSDKVNIYTTFFDSCWREEDGDKADCADITIRMMRTGDQPRNPIETTGESNSKVKTEPFQDPFINEPFLDPIELIDPRVRKWRDILRRAYSGKKHKMPTSNIKGVKTVGEIIQDNPLLKQLIDNDNDREPEHQ